VEDPTARLVEALDRLRATEGPQQAEVELTRHLRGARYYQDESRHAPPVVPPPDAIPDGPSDDPGEP
jgi:hypothetical protein